jgi:glutathione synthase/RimK-type ligase-like ATP-grasp enzyme
MVCDMSRIAFVTCADLSGYFPSAKNPLLTHDDQVAADALVARGHQVEPLIWGTAPEEIRRAGFDFLIIRSCWDYMDSVESRKAFMAWIDVCDAAGLPMQNPPALLRWNLDKHYLADLQSAGVPIVPTRFVEPGEGLDLAALFEAQGPLVLKPCISAAAVDAFLFEDSVQARDFDFDGMRKERTFMLQPFLTEVLSEGEWSLVFIAGKFTHALLKRPADGDWRVQDERGGSVFSAEPPDGVLACAQAAMERLPACCGTEGSPLYARVDVLRAADPLLGELEMIEPELFFLQRLPGGVQPHAPTIEAFCRALL